MTGTVVNVNNDPLPVVTVIAKGTTFGTTTDVSGKYALDVPEGSILIFSFVGMSTQEITIGNRTVKADMFIHFIYNEKAREFLSEGLSWEDHQNAGILYDRVVYLNQMASDKTGLWPVADNPSGANGQNGNGKGTYIEAYTFRVWPKAYLDLLTDEAGLPLDDATKAAYQNPGY